MTLPHVRLLALSACLLAACAGTPVEPSYYLLRVDGATTSRALAPAPYRLGPVSVAPYINRAGLLLEIAPGQVRPARNHLWAEPVQEGVRALLTTEISRALGQDILPLTATSTGPVISVRIEQFHGTQSGEAKLEAFWGVSEGDSILAAQQFAATLPLSRDGYGALAEAQRALLQSLAQAIAAGLNPGLTSPPG